MRKRTPRQRLSMSAVALIALAALCALGGCAKPKAPDLYGWNGYEKNLDTYFRGDRESLDAQAQMMEADLEKIRSAGKATPPGYRAHLGLLYGKQGDMARFQEHLEAEKQVFPESETFIDFLLRKFKKN